MDCLTQEYCSDGCESFLEAKCIIFTDGETLETKITRIEQLLINLAECVCETNNCSVGTPSGITGLCL